MRNGINGPVANKEVEKTMEVEIIKQVIVLNRLNFR
jgi:hypothetical protein